MYRECILMYLYTYKTWKVFFMCTLSSMFLLQITLMKFHISGHQLLVTTASILFLSLKPMINLSPLLETVHCYLMTTFVCHSRQYPKVVHQNTDRYIEDGMGGESLLQLKKNQKQNNLKKCAKEQSTWRRQYLFNKTYTHKKVLVKSYLIIIS